MLSPSMARRRVMPFGGHKYLGQPDFIPLVSADAPGKPEGSNTDGPIPQRKQQPRNVLTSHSKRDPVGTSRTQTQNTGKRSPHVCWMKVRPDEGSNKGLLEAAPNGLGGRGSGEEMCGRQAALTEGPGQRTWPAQAPRLPRRLPGSQMGPAAWKIKTRLQQRADGEAACGGQRSEGPDLCPPAPAGAPGSGAPALHSGPPALAVRAGRRPQAGQALGGPHGSLPPPGLSPPSLFCKEVKFATLMH